MTKEELTDKYVAEQWGNKKVARAAFKAGWESCIGQLWKDANGDELPAYDREVVVLLDKWNGRELAPYFRVGIAHRPDPKGWDGKSLTTRKVEHFDVQTYDKGGWNGPGVKYWLDVDIPENNEQSV